MLLADFDKYMRYNSAVMTHVQMYKSKSTHVTHIALPNDRSMFALNPRLDIGK